MSVPISTEQRSSFAPYVERWLRADIAGPRLDDREHGDVVAAIRRCYASAGLPWPNRVMWVETPAEGGRTARAAAADVLIHRAAAAAKAHPWWQRMRNRITVAISGLASILVAGPLLAFQYGAFGYVAAGVVGIARQVPPIDDGRWPAAWVGAGFGLLLGLRFWLNEVVGTARDKTRALLTAATAEINATGERIRAATIQAIEAELVRTVESDAVATVGENINQPIDEALTAVRTAGRNNRPISRAERVPELEPMRSTGEIAGLLWWRDHGGVMLPDELSETAQALADTRRVSWWPHPDFVVVAEPPLEVHFERTASGVVQLHRADGPALRFADGSDVHIWRGVHVPQGLIRGEWGVERIHREQNSEVRRAAIERMGWLTYIDKAELRLLASCPDPGNDPHQLELYWDPRRRLGDARILVMTNGSPDRTGETRRYAETVPDYFSDPVAAAAWQYDCPVETYRAMQRRT